MQIKVMRISEVKPIAIDERDRLYMEVNFKNASNFQQFNFHRYIFMMENPADVQRLARLMRYTGAYNHKGLLGKQICIVENSLSMNSLLGFANSHEDKFVPFFTKEFKEVSRLKFEELLKNE